jgi:hypothetical protein
MVLLSASSVTTVFLSNQNGGIPDRLRAIAIKQGLGYSPKTPEEAAKLERIINTESDVVMPEMGQPAAGSAQGLGSIPSGDSQYGGPDVYGNRGEDPYAPYYQEYLPTGQETTPISIPRTSEVDSSGMDPTFLCSVTARSTHVTNADLGSEYVPLDMILLLGHSPHPRPLQNLLRKKKAVDVWKGMIANL